jgi:hypothetical protein
VTQRSLMLALAGLIAGGGLVGGGGCAPKQERAQELPVVIPPNPLRADPVCTSGLFRDPNESEGDKMMPGGACNKCHYETNAASGEGDAPLFAAAGTVFPTGHEPDNCRAVASEGAWVVITDATGVEYRIQVNDSGNFILENVQLNFPIHAKVVNGDKERAMQEAQDIADCNDCHTQKGDYGAPGRITLP